MVTDRLESDLIITAQSAGRIHIMEKITSYLSGFGVPMLIFLIAIDATGLTGAAAITAALAMLGPGGMVGGVAFLLAIGIISRALPEYGIGALYKSFIKKLREKGETDESIMKAIDCYPISSSLKAQCKQYILDHPVDDTTVTEVDG